jgi:S1-C subfamily serine protease
MRPLESPAAEGNPVEADSLAVDRHVVPLNPSAHASDAAPATGGRLLADLLSALRPYLPWATAAWLAGVMLLSLRPFWGWLHVRRLKRHGLSPLSETLDRAGESLMQRLGVSRAVRFAQSTLVEVPAVVGYLRPLVLLPASAILGLSTSEIEMVLAHELAHVRRHDYLVNLAQTVIEALLFYHPGMWWVSSQIRFERENCCDDIAVALCGTPASYVRALARLEEQRSATPATVLAATGGSLVIRVRRLLGQPHNEFGYRNATSWLAGLVTSVILIAAFLLSAASNHNVARADDDADAPGKPEALGAQQFEPALADVYRQVTPATVRVSPREGSHRWFHNAIVVSPDGYVLHNGVFAASTELRYEFSDGRTATGKALGRSSEWHIGLSKIEKPGPWPYVKLAAPDGVDVGQCVVSIQYPYPDSPLPVRSPLLLVDWVNRAAPGLWFTLATAQAANAGHWNDCRFVVDLQGRLAGLVARLSHGAGVMLTDARVVESLWDDLAAGKNLDQVRLDKSADAQAQDEAAAVVKEIPKEVKQKVVAASVHIRSVADVRAGKSGWSGTIVSADGLVATCAHHHEMPGADVVVSLPDGRDLAGKVLGVNIPCDIGLVQITDAKDVLPHVEMGDSTRLRPGAPCLFAGYGPVPKMLRQALVRTTTVVEPPDGQWSHLVHSDPNTKFVGGDSGGGLFNSEGQLIAFHTGIGSLSGPRRRPHQNPRVELFREHWDELHAPFRQSNDSPLAATREEMDRTYRRVGGSIVKILDGENQVALGTIVDRSGLLLTKASVLPDRFNCRLADGRVLPGKVLRTVREHDVAVVKIDADDLAVIEWSTIDEPPVGSATVLALANGEPTLGFVSVAPLAFPSEKGHLRAELRDTDGGLEVKKLSELEMLSDAIFYAIPPCMLEPGDILLNVDGRPTPNFEAYRKLIEDKSGDPVAVSGDAVRLVVSRKGQQIELRDVLGPPTGPRMAGQTPRSTGFPRVLSVNTNATTEMCGGPVIDRTGRAIGIAIAWRNNGWLLVLPADTAKSITTSE